MIETFIRFSEDDKHEMEVELMIRKDGELISVDVENDVKSCASAFYAIVLFNMVKHDQKLSDSIWDHVENFIKENSDEKATEKTEQSDE